jgi:hypothetical protein
MEEKINFENNINDWWIKWQRIILITILIEITTNMK